MIDLFYLQVSTSSPSADINLSTESVNKNLSNAENKSLLTSEDDPIAITETVEYKPINYHWFYSDLLLEKTVWLPMSHKDSNNLEIEYKKNFDKINELISTNSESKRSFTEFVVQIKGGRYEVDLVELIKRPVYWEEKNVSYVRRCLWFHKESSEKTFTPYEQEYSEFLEREYEKTLRTNMFHKRIDYISIKKSSSNMSLVPGTANNTDSKMKKIESQQSFASEEAFVFHSTSIMMHFTQANMLDEFGNLNSDAKRPRIVKRGIDEVVDKIEPDEIDRIDHICFVIHGIGEGCDMKFRPIVDCVNDMRDNGAIIIDSHLKSHINENKLNGRVEFLPISWHQELHGDETGLDDRMKPITLPSIPKLRQFSNSTIVDVLFYTSPIYCQIIISKVGNEMNRLMKIFRERNPYFNGKISLIGHSLGSVICYDLLSHQLENSQDTSSNNEKTNEKYISSAIFEDKESLDEFLSRYNLTDYKELFAKEKITMKSLTLLNENDLIQIGLPIGPRRILMDALKSNSLKKEKEDVERKIKNNLEILKQQEKEQKEQIELNFNYGLAGTGQLSVKYPKLNFEVSNFFALGSPIAIFLTVRGVSQLGFDFKLPTCENFFNIFHPFDPVAYRIEPLINQVVLKPVLMPHHKGRKRMHLELKENLSKVGEEMYGQFKSAWSSITEFAKFPMLGANTPGTSIEANIQETSTVKTEPLQLEPLPTSEEKDLYEPVTKIDLGKLNKGRRIDYVLQEAPYESFNDYVFAVASHACYWESEDTILMITKEIYDLEHTTDANTELVLTDEQKQQSSWLTNAAAASISNNVQKTFSYFNIGMPQSLTSALSATLANSINLNSSIKKLAPSSNK